MPALPTMKAIRLERTGGPEVLEDVDVPASPAWPGKSSFAMKQSA